jgi:hypothetical protein
MDNYFLVFVHSLLRYVVLLTVAGAGILHLRGYLAKRPILTGERTLAIVAMVLCHVQLVVGALLYAVGFNSFNDRFGGRPDLLRFWKMEHITVMVLAVALVTIGRVLSKKAKTERAKQHRIALFYLIGLAMMLAMIPWPFLEKFSHVYKWI